MTTFDEREKAFEERFVHDEELAFKVIAHRNKMLGLWAAAKLGKKGPEAEAYAKETVLAAFESSGDVTGKIIKDFTKGKVALGEKDIRVEMERLLPIARKQIFGEEK